MRQSITLLMFILFFLLSCKKEKDDKLSITMLNSADGLPDNWIYCITEDNSGNIWIGTEDGVGKYDGEQCQTYFDTLQLHSKRVRNIIVDNLGVIWIDFYFDPMYLYKYNGVTLEKTNLLGELYKNLDSSINYFYSNHTIFQYKDNDFEEIEIPLDDNDKCFVNQVLKDTKGNFWVSSNSYCMKGLLKFDGVKWTDYDTIDVVYNELNINNVNAIIESKNSNILYSNVNSIIQFDGINSCVILNYRSKIGKPILNYGLFEDSNSNIWFGFDCAYKYNGSNVQAIEINSFPKHNNYTRIIITFFEDSKGIIWIGTVDGIFKIK